MKRWLAALMALALMGRAAALPAMGELHAPSAALYDENGQVLFEKNADERLQPASVTKLMTLLLAMEALDRGEVKLTDPVTGSAHAASMGGTQIWLREGEQLPLDEMLKAIAVGSANDCAVAVAEHLAGTEEAFVEQMNARAKALGCTGTRFINANGLDADGQKTLTTANDLAKISAELLRHPKILDYTTIWMDTIRGGQFSLANTNKMLRKYPGLIGLKTGYISQAGFCISAAAEREGLRLIAVVMAAPTKEERMADAAALLNYGFANFAAYTPVLEGRLSPVPVSLGRERAVAVEAPEMGRLTVPREQAAALKTEVELPQCLEAPVQRGQVLGRVVISDGGEAVKTTELRAAEDVPRLRTGELCALLLRLVLCRADPEEGQDIRGK